MYQIIVADHQDLYRAGIVALLESSECCVIAECSDWIGLVQAVKVESASIVIASIVMVIDLEWLILRTQKARGRVLLVGEDADSLNCYRAAGASGALHRSASASVFLDTFQRTLEADDFVLPFEGSPSLHLNPRLARSLTPRELKIMGLLMEGFKNRHIAKHLDVAEYVVRGAFQKIFDKTGFSNRLELALFLSHCR
jgi:DNA-binding NarL/FixJ family response regulator